MDNIITISSRAERELKRLDRKIKNRIVTAVFSLIKDSRPPGCLKVKTSERLWRIRVGDWRVGYEIDDASQTVTIVTIGHRSEFYD
jgi:mRNA interferase RelE/StbE